MKTISTMRQHIGDSCQLPPQSRKHSLVGLDISLDLIGSELLGGISTTSQQSGGHGTVQLHLCGILEV